MQLTETLWSLRATLCTGVKLS